MIPSLRSQQKWPRLLKLLSHPNRQSRLKPLSRLQCSRAPVCRQFRLFLLYQQFLVFPQYQPFRQFLLFLLFPAEISAFAEPAPSSTT